MMIWSYVQIGAIYLCITLTPYICFAEPMPAPTGATVKIDNENYTPDDPQDYQGSRRRIWAAWQTYWKGDLQGALKLFKAEAIKHPTAFYNSTYIGKVLLELPPYDGQLLDLKANRARSSPSEQRNINRKIYDLSKEFYKRCGMEGEGGSIIYGPEFDEAERLLLTLDDEVASNYLERYYYQVDSCYMGKPDEPIRAFRDFLNRFPSSKYQRDIQHLLTEYQEGRMTCDGSRGSEN